MFLRPSLACLRKAQVTIPKLSPTHTRARIIKWCTPIQDHTSAKNLECYDPLFVLECSPDMVSEGYRQHPDHCPTMLIESQEEGTFRLNSDVQLNTWYDVGTVLGEIDDGDDDDDADDNGEWLWQAYSHEEKDGDKQ
jgi:hypothetical protein